MTTSGEYMWVAGGDKAITRVAPISSGGFGDVYEITSEIKEAGITLPIIRRRATILRKFARKTVRTGDVPIEDIKREAQVVTRLKDGEQHKNLVRILDHGWLKNVPSVYFIDMELCDLTLHEYIVYLHGPTQNIIEECFPSMSWETDAVFVSRTSPLMARIRNIWEIGIHIASGLEFMHRCGLVHRDLKPKNVLFSRREQLWKLTDFGISAEATSKRARTTIHARGTACYRAPELLMDEGTFTNKVDIWALGCVVSEVATGDIVFMNDWAVRDYYLQSGRCKSHATLRQWPDIFRHHFSENIAHLLMRPTEERPAASLILNLFQSYLKALFEIDVIIGANAYPTYTEWLSLIEKTRWTPAGRSEDFLYEVANIFAKRGQQEIGSDLRRRIDAKLAWSLQEPKGGMFTYWLSEVCFQRGDYVAASQALMDSIREEPGNIWAWHKLFQVYVARYRLGEETLQFAKIATNSQQGRLASALHVSLIHAARGNYDSAIKEFARSSSEVTLDNWVTLTKEYANSIYRPPDAPIPVTGNMVQLQTGLYSQATVENWVKRWITIASMKCLGTSLAMTVHSAAWWGDTNFIKTVALEDPSQLVAKHVSGYTALHLAIWNRHKDLVRLLLDSFWWRHKQTENCWTYLQIAAYNNDVEVLRWLREKRLAEVSDVNYVISWAEENGYTRVIEALSQSNIIKPGDYGIWIIV